MVSLQTDVSAVFAYVSSVKDNNEVETIKVMIGITCGLIGGNYICQTGK